MSQEQKAEFMTNLSALSGEQLLPFCLQWQDQKGFSTLLKSNPDALTESEKNLCRDRLLNQLLWPMLKSLQFDFVLMNLSGLLCHWQVPASNPTEWQALAVHTQKIFEQQKTNPLNAFMILHMRLLSESWANNPSARQNYLIDLFKLNPQELLASQDNMTLFSEAWRGFFPDLKVLLTILSEAVFDFSHLNSLSLNEQKNAFVWVMAVLWNVYPEQEPISRALYSKWQELWDCFQKDNNDEMVLFLYTPLSHLGTIFDRLSEHRYDFNERVEKKLAAYVRNRASDWGMQAACDAKSLQNKTELRFGIVYDRLVWTSVGKILLHLLKGFSKHGPKDIKIFVYNVQKIEESADDPQMLQSVFDLKVPLYQAHDALEDKNKGFQFSVFGKLKKLRHKIQEDKIDVLAVMGLHVFKTALLASRAAPVQLYWTHGFDEYDVAEIDARIIHGGIHRWGWKSIHHTQLAGHRYYFFPVAREEQDFVPKPDSAAVAAIKKQFPDGTVFLGSIGNLIKLNTEDYLLLVCRLLQKHPNCVFLACGPYASDQIGFYKEIEQTFQKQGVLDRVVFPGFIDATVYGEVIDVFLNPFPRSHGEALSEYCARGRLAVIMAPSVLKDKAYQSETVNLSALPFLHHRADLDDFYRMDAYSVKDYENLAEFFISKATKDTELQQQIVVRSKLCFNIRDKLLNVSRAVLEASDLIRSLAAGTPPSNEPKDENISKCTYLDKKEETRRLQSVLDYFKDAKKSGQKVLLLGVGFDPIQKKILSPVGIELAELIQNQGHQVSVCESHSSLADLKKAVSFPVADPSDNFDVLVLLTPICGTVDLWHFKKIWKSGQSVLDVQGAWQEATSIFEKLGVTYRNLSLA